MKKEVREGCLESALLLLSEQGGQVFPGRDGTDGITYLCGSKQIIFWKPKSKKRAELYRLAKTLDYPDPELATGGALVRHCLDIAGVQWKGTYFHPCWQKQAYDGWHWHYEHWIEGRHGFCMEIDLRSAYWTAFANAPSCLLHGLDSWSVDNGALANLDAIMQMCPKWFRLQFLGTIASWKMQFYVKDKKSENPREFVLKTRKQITYGGLFNAAHKAILTVYGDMRRGHQIIGKDCVRCHTDSFLVKIEPGMEWEDRFNQFIKGRGYELTIKKMGDAWLRDLNCGWIGNYPLGSKRIALDYAKEEGLKLNRTPPELLERINLHAKKHRYILALK